MSRLCLGTMNFGPFTPEPQAHTVLDRALELGINFFDTANVYGRTAGKGRTEEIIGSWFARGGERREKTVLATKVHGRWSDWPNDGRLSARHIRAACDASLRRLGTEYIDLYQMHHVDRSTPWEEIWQAMQVLVEQGKVLYVGSSNFAGWHLAVAQAAAAERHFLGLVSEQSLYNLAERTIELEVLPACQHLGIGVIPWSPLHGGMLGGALRRQDKVRSTEEFATEKLDRLRPQLERFEKLAEELGEEPAHVALAWLLHQPGVTGPIIGPRTLEQLDDAVRSLDIKLDSEVLGQLDAIFPGPGGPAPEAYAW